MRKHTLNITVTCNIDITSLSSRRVSITHSGVDKYTFTSSLKFYKCERHDFVNRYLKRRAKVTAIIGCCSAPTGYELTPA